MINQVQVQSFVHHDCQALKAPARYFMGSGDTLSPTLPSCSHAPPTPRVVVKDKALLHWHTPPSCSFTWMKPLNARVLHSAGKINFPTPRMRAGARLLLSQKHEEEGEEEGGEMEPEAKTKRKEEDG